MVPVAQPGNLGTAGAVGIRMDVLSHGLWGGVAFGRATRRAYWTAFAIGMLPDLLSFGPHFAESVWSAAQGADFRPASPGRGYADIPPYVFAAYDVTHSLVVFLAAFLLVWALRRRPYWPLAAWGLHVVMDIPTHSLRFFPTPFLWPFFDVAIDGVSWGRPIVFVPNVILLAAVYAWYLKRGRHRNASR